MNPRDPATGAPLRAALQVANHLGHNAAIFLVGQSTAVCGYVVIGISQPQTDPVIVSRTVASTRSCRQASHAAQPGTATTISVFSGLRAPPVYRNDSLWLVDVSGAAPPATGSAITFAEISLRDWPAAPRLVQEGQLPRDDRWSYYPAIAVDAVGNAAIVFGRSAADEYPSLYVTGRLAADAPGTLREPLIQARRVRVQSESPAGAGAFR
ncbi:MAG TPA: hypothetical protein VEC39_07355 [Vicinamibacterales bacterium]|nr:hypothetical protein [Vicinamibacterales bacterium]